MKPSELAAWRDAARLTLDEAAALFGVSRRTYVYWEQGKTRGKLHRDDVPALAALAWCEVCRRLEKSRARPQKTD